MRLFISYPGRGRAMAEQVAEVCRRHGHEAFVAEHAPDTLVGRAGWLAELAVHVERCDAFVLCLGEGSVSSQFQQLEWTHAIVADRRLRFAVYAGEWDPAFRHAFPFVDGVQHFRLDLPAGLRALEEVVGRLAPPEEERFQLARRLVVEAGTRLMLRYSRVTISGRPAVLDDRKNYATEIDREVQDFLTREIVERFPGDGILAEEADPRLGVKPDAEYVWTIDPLDGTLNFMVGDDRFCCGIGLLRRGQPYFGLILVPARMELYTGGVGRPAERRLLLEGTVQSLRTDPTVTQLRECCTLTHINSEDANIARCFEGDFPRRLHGAVRRVWMWGCGLLALTAVSRGSHHLFVQRVTYPWDVAPGLAILHAAGGVSSDWPAPARRAWSLPTGGERRGVVAAASEQVLNAFFKHFTPGA